MVTEAGAEVVEGEEVDIIMGIIIITPTIMDKIIIIMGRTTMDTIMGNP